VSVTIEKTCIKLKFKPLNYFCAGLTVFSFFHLCILPRIPEVTVSSPSEEGGWQQVGRGEKPFVNNMGKLKCKLKSKPKTI